MADENNGMAKGLLIGLLAGSVVGAIVALLYAPKSGKELRSEIKQKASDLKDDAAEYLRMARAKAADIINDGKRRSDQLVTDAKQQAEQLLGDAEKMLTGIRERAGEEAGKVKAAFKAGADAYKNEKGKSS
jgi:gas vesicle protein